VLFALNSKSAIAIEDLSSFPEERELVLRKGVRFKVTKVYRPSGTDRAVVIEAEEL